MIKFALKLILWVLLVIIIYLVGGMIMGSKNESKQQKSGDKKGELWNLIKDKYKDTVSDIKHLPIRSFFLPFFEGTDSSAVENYQPNYEDINYYESLIQKIVYGSGLLSDVQRLVEAAEKGDTLGWNQFFKSAKLHQEKLAEPLAELKKAGGEVQSKYKFYVMLSEMEIPENATEEKKNEWAAAQRNNKDLW